VRYGQWHAAELAAARRVAEALGITRHVVVDIDLRAIGGSALTADIPVPRAVPEAAAGGGIPVTCVPARNTILLALALALAETVGAFDIFIGVNAVDCSGCPDCHPAFLAAFETLAAVATMAGTGGTAPRSAWTTASRSPATAPPRRARRTAAAMRAACGCAGSARPGCAIRRRPAQARRCSGAARLVIFPPPFAGATECRVIPIASTTRCCSLPSTGVRWTARTSPSSSRPTGATK
jgi:queuosine biosynthesis protein QueC